MKTLLLTIIAFLIVLEGITQDRPIINSSERDLAVLKIPENQVLNGYSKEVEESMVLNPPMTSLIGTTYYDLQTNASNQSRIYLHNDGTIGATWTYGFSYPQFSDRGTGYNYYNGTSWAPIPMSRIEPDRAGWPSYSPWNANGEIVVSHYSGGSAAGLAISNRSTKGSGVWSYYVLNGPSSNTELLWPRSATGGSNNQILHVVALTKPVSNGGVPYLGQNGALLYSRSINGGQSWEVQNMSLPGIGSGFYTGFSGDTYEIIAKDNNVAILIGDEWKGMVLLKSSDFGNTWGKTIIWDHPYPLWDPNNQFLTDTFYCADGAHAMAYDNSGKVHVAFGINRAYSNGSVQYWFPLVDGIGYWHEDMTTFSNHKNALSPYGDPGSELIDNYNLIGWMQDFNSNGVLDILGEPGLYYLGASSMPQLIFDSMNNIFLIYSSITESYNNGLQDYRHLWARGSSNGGITWGNFVHLNSNVVYIFSECVFPSCSPTSDMFIHLVYQTDNEPGMAVRGDEDPYSENHMLYMKVPKSDLVSIPDIGNLSGTVTNANGGTPISGATITIEGTTYNAVTGSSGNYSISNIPIGEYTVHCEKTGYYSQVATTTIIDNQTTTLNFQLSEVVIPGDQVIGTTWYDMQSNYSMMNRIYLYPDGYIGATYMYGVNHSSFPDRGTGYNSFNGTAWGPVPTQRIESQKAGWPSYAPLGTSGELVVSHYTDGPLGGKLAISKRVNKGSGNWITTSFAPPAGAPDLIWPRAVTGGDNSNTIHLITLTRPTLNGGTPYLGQDGALLYSRSIDGGQNWNIQNSVINGLGSAYYDGFSGDIYTLAHPKGNKIAMVIGNPNCDLILMKSQDNGTTWTKTIVWEHPFPNGVVNPADTFYCPDGTHSLVIDNSGKVHLAFGITRIQYDGMGSYFHYQMVGGIGYWNEDRPVFSNNLNALSPYNDPGSELTKNYNLIGWEQDVNNNGTWDILGSFGTYFIGSSSMPQLISDDSNNIFLVYSSVTETFNNGLKDYRQLWARGSTDNGESWGIFVNVTSDFIYSECVFPSCSPTSDDFVHMIFQRDNEPGIAVKFGDHPYNENKIEYLKISKADLLVPMMPGNLAGQVTSAATGAPIGGAAIIVQGTSFSAITQTDGTYSISAIPVGDYLVECSKEGYDTQTALISITQNNTFSQDFQLEPVFLEPPENLVAFMINEDVMLQWDPPPSTTGDWLYWGDGVNEGNGIGLVIGGTFYAASRWLPQDLAPYNNSVITKISFFPLENTNTEFNLYVWKGENAAMQLLSQTVLNCIPGEFNIVELYNPITIDATQELWFGYSVTHPAGIVPAGCDEGPAIIGKGDMISLDGNDWNPMSTTFGLNYNWNLVAFAALDLDNIYQSEPMVKSSITAEPSEFISVRDSKNPEKDPKIFSSLLNSNLMGYNVYRDNIFIGSASSTYYTDENITPGSYEYFVTALYDLGESGPSNSAFIEYSPCLPPINVVAAIVNQSEISVEWEAPPFAIDSSYRVVRNGEIIATTTAYQYIDSGLEPGDYEYCVASICGEEDSDYACADTVTILYLPPPTFLEYSIENNNITLVWGSPELKNMLGFKIYHKHNNGNFEEIAFINSTIFVYPNAATGLHYFYVTAVYDEGESTPSMTAEVIITQINETYVAGLNIFPNPANDKITIISDLKVNNIYIFNSFGQLYLKQQVNNKHFQADISGYNAGVYHIKLEYDEFTVTRRIVIK
jgi:hypothetical protein